MLKKLTIYEIKKTWKIIALICGTILGTGIFISVVGKHSGDSAFLHLLTSLALMLHCSAYMLTFIYLPVRYYKSLFKSEGYLSFTLPASVKQVISSKMLTGIIWTLAVFFTMANVFPIHSQAARDALSPEDIGSAAVVITIFSLITVSNLFISYFSVTIGRLWNKHILLGTIICYAFTWSVVITLAFNVFTALSTVLYPNFGNGDGTISVMQAWIIFAAEAISAVILCFLLNHTSAVITEKTLNLE